MAPCIEILFLFTLDNLCNLYNHQWLSSSFEKYVLDIHPVQCAVVGYFQNPVSYVVTSFMAGKLPVTLCNVRPFCMKNNDT